MVNRSDDDRIVEIGMAFWNFQDSKLPIIIINNDIIVNDTSSALVSIDTQSLYAGEETRR